MSKFFSGSVASGELPPAGFVFSFAASAGFVPAITAHAAKVPAAIHPRVAPNVAAPVLFFLSTFILRVICFIHFPKVLPCFTEDQGRLLTSSSSAFPSERWHPMGMLRF
jgi:hypothetical protein